MANDLVATLREHYRARFGTLHGPRPWSGEPYLDTAPERTEDEEDEEGPDYPSVSIPHVLVIALNAKSATQKQGALEGAADALAEELSDWRPLKTFTPLTTEPFGWAGGWPAATHEGALLLMATHRTGCLLPEEVVARLEAQYGAAPETTRRDIAALLLSDRAARDRVPEDLLAQLFREHLAAAPLHAFELIDADWLGCADWLKPTHLLPFLSSDDPELRTRAMATLGSLRKKEQPTRSAVR